MAIKRDLFLKIKRPLKSNTWLSDWDIATHFGIKKYIVRRTCIKAGYKLYHVIKHLNKLIGLISFNNPMSPWSTNTYYKTNKLKSFSSGRLFALAGSRVDHSWLHQLWMPICNKEYKSAKLPWSSPHWEMLKKGENDADSAIIYQKWDLDSEKVTPDAVQKLMSTVRRKLRIQEVLNTSYLFSTYNKA